LSTTSIDYHDGVVCIYIYIYTYVQYICICMVLVHACSPSLWQEVRQGRAGQGKVRSDQVRYYMYVSKAGGEKSSRSGLGGGRTGHLPLVDVDQVGRKDAAPDALDTAAPTTQTNKQTNKQTHKQELRRVSCEVRCKRERRRE